MAKMTPFRSYIVTATVAAETALLGTVQLKGGVITYIMVCQSGVQIEPAVAQADVHCSCHL